MTRKELKRAIRDAWGRYTGTLDFLLKKQGKQLHGLQMAHDILGQPATDAYDLFKAEQKEAQDAFGRAVDFKFMKKYEARKALEAEVAKRNQAEHDVSYFAEYLEREKVRAKAVMMYAGATQDEHDAIVRDAENKLREAQVKLELLH